MQLPAPASINILSTSSGRRGRIGCARAPAGTGPNLIVVLGNLILTPDRPGFTAFGVFEGETLDFTRPASSAVKASYRDANSFTRASPVALHRAAQEPRPMRMESRRRCLYAALVTMMESANFWDRNNPPHVRRLNRARNWGVLLQSQVRPASMIVVHETLQVTGQARSAEHDYVVQAFAVCDGGPCTCSRSFRRRQSQA